MTAHGTFAVDRGIFDHPALGDEPFTRREAWLWLLSEAAFRPRSVGRTGKTIELGRGQLCHSLRFMGGRWGWLETKVRRFLDRLKTDAMIDAATDASTTIITICNYDKYQFVIHDTDAATDAGIDALATQERRKREEGNNKRKNLFHPKSTQNPRSWPIDAFEQFWSVVPKKTGKGTARKSFTKLQESGALEFSALMAATKRWAIREVTASVTIAGSSRLPRPG